MILIVSVCEDRLHYYEFVRPINDICQEEGLKTRYKHYLEVENKDLEECTKAIICGTGLLDYKILKNPEKLGWIKKFNKPILGICAGMQIIAEVFGCRIVEGLDIGLRTLDFKEEFLGIKGNHQVYSMHSMKALVNKEFEKECILGQGEKEIVHCIKKRDKQIYGVLFHPEVRNKEMIINFLKNRLE